MAETRCPRCGFPLVEERVAGRGMFRVALVAAVAVLAVFAAPPALRAVSGAFVPASEAMSAAQAERHLAEHYPSLRRAEHAVIACPRHRIEPGGQTRCWVLARVGLQRSVVVRLSPRGNEVEIDD
jgi:hypothetical protein